MILDNMGIYINIKVYNIVIGKLIAIFWNTFCVQGIFGHVFKVEF